MTPVVTPADIAVAPGEHLVRVGRGGYTAFEETVTVRTAIPVLGASWRAPQISR